MDKVQPSTLSLSGGPQAGPHLLKEDVGHFGPCDRHIQQNIPKTQILGRKKIRQEKSCLISERHGYEKRCHSS